MCYSNKSGQLLSMMMMMIFSSLRTRERQNGKEAKHAYNMTLVCKVIEVYYLVSVILKNTVDSDEDPIGRKHK